jgi:hypothetical protein
MMTLIFTTTNEGYRGLELGRSYILMDPKYLYPAKPLVKDGYQNSPLSYAQKSEPFATGLEDLMLNREEVVNSKIQMLISDIYLRRDIKKENIHRIYLDQCACRTLVYRLDEKIWDKKRMDMERKIIDLEQEKRREMSDYFRDILFLKKDLREALVEKLEEKQKSEMLIETKEELPCPV